MRRGLGLLGLVVTVIIVAIVGVIAYQVGWSDGFAQHVPTAANGTTTAVPPYPYYYYGYGPHFFGFGWIIGLLFFVFLAFIFFRVLAFGLFGWRRGGWGYGGHGWGRMYSGGSGVPPAIDERMREWHQRAHGDQPPGSTPPPPPPVPDQK